MSAALRRLYGQVRDFVGVHRDLAAFAALPDLPDLEEPRPVPHPDRTMLASIAAKTAPQTRGVYEAIADADALLEWRQSYSAAQVGTEYLSSYGWFSLASPEGPFLVPDLRVTVGLWGGGLRYPRHWHEPEEIYCVLAGSADFHADGATTRRLGAGETWHNPSNRPHGMSMTEGPLLALAIWKGEGLLAVSTLETDG